MTAQKQWDAPECVVSEERLKLYNSLLDDKCVFVPRGGPASKDVYWYCCGPTVYDSAHIGHARNYVTFDIIRRVLEDYFGYNITYVMNVTDVDDKIIKRARRNRLVAAFLEEGKSSEEAVNLCIEAFAAVVPKQEAEVAAAQQRVDACAFDCESRIVQAYTEALEGEKLKLSKMEGDAKRLEDVKAAGSTGTTAEQVAKDFHDIIAEHLDNLHGSTVTDIDIYRAHAAKFEKQFFDDLADLGCRMPHAIPRITDHIPEIVAFIDRIMKQGFGYAAGEAGKTSVYFDTAAFRAAGHRYGRLEPSKVGAADLASEGESNFKTTEKRCDQDFVLWKASKAGEPAWESPWGPGRPGWHIECSAMVDSVLGRQIDIHSGGMDLRFPHHDNEIAQSEAHNRGSCPPSGFAEQWCNYWLHSGHLHIDGLKMSKSLKNFITIREALREFSARQLRLLFCLSSWRKEITFNQQSRGEMVQKEASLKNFFLSVQVVLRQNVLEKSNTKALPEHKAIAEAIAACQASVHAALLDSIDTVTAMKSLLELVTKVNVYIKQLCPDAGIQPDALRVRQAAEYVTRILRVFGLSDAGPDSLGFGGGAAAAAAAAQGADATRTVFRKFCCAVRDLPALQGAEPAVRDALQAAAAAPPDNEIAGMSADAAVDALVACRDAVREAARGAGAAKGPIMTLCDEVRDCQLVDVGVKLEDKPTGGVWMRVDPAELRQEVIEKKKAAAMAALDKAEKKLSMAKDELAKAEGVLQFSSTQEALATRFRFDAAGTVTHELKESAWEEVDAKRMKAISKIMEKEEKMRAPFRKKVEQNGNYLDDMKANVTELERKVAQLNIDAS